MIKRTIEISNTKSRMRVEHDQLVIMREGLEDRTIPVEDIGVLLIDQQATSYTHAVLVRLMEAGACVVLCDQTHLPCGLVLPMQSNELLTQRLRRQIDVSGPKQKRLWQQIVRAKIAAQAVNLKIASGPTDGEAEKLRSLIPKVASGDPANIEGQAARIYWPALFGKSFRREQGGAWPNPFLNYGYMVMRAALARAIAGADLHPSSGIHHHNRGNAFCLADDLVEPLRPLVDAAVFGALAERAAAGDPVLSPGNKRMTLELLARDVELVPVQCNQPRPESNPRLPSLTRPSFAPRRLCLTMKLCLRKTALTKNCAHTPALRTPKKKVAFGHSSGHSSGGRPAAINPGSGTAGSRRFPANNPPAPQSAKFHWAPHR